MAVNDVESVRAPCQRSQGNYGAEDVSEKMLQDPAEKRCLRRNNASAGWNTVNYDTRVEFCSFADFTYEMNIMP
jgi:hypothetical protein